jgi:hypothetical protein
MRSIPDVAIDADPATGMVICEASAGGCPVPAAYGGTSVATPEWAAYAALLNEAVGHNLGALNPQLYPLANLRGFQNAASMSSDFAHVGLGSPNVDQLYLSLTGQHVGSPSAVNSAVVAMTPVQTLLTSNTSAAIEGSLPADGASLGGVLVQLFDSNGNAVSGKTVTLSSSEGISVSPASAVTSVANGAAVFTFTSTTVSQPTFTATDVTDGITLSQTASISIVPPPAAGGSISANPSTVAANGQSTAVLIVTLTDSLNRPSPGKIVTISDGGAHAVITGPVPGVTNASGQIQFTATDQVSETVTFSAIDVTDGSLPVPGSATVTYSNSAGSACGVGVTATAAAGYTIKPFITGLPAAATVFYENVNVGCPGAENPVFTSGGSTLAGDFLTGGLYQTGQTGGAVSSTNLLSTLGPSLANLTYGKDGSLYATTGTSSAQLLQINPTTGAVLRTVASGLVCPTGLSVDPVSGDLFFDDDCTGAGLNNASIFRVIDPADSNPSQPTSVVVYATLPTSPNGGMAFAPDGTLYAVSGYYGNPNAPVEQVSGTNSPTVTVTAVPGVSSDFAVAIGAVNADGSAQSLIVEPAGTLTDIPIANPSSATVLATGSPGVGITGPDGCLYSAHYDTVYRLANSSGTCNFAPTSPAPSMNLAPATVTRNPAQGTALTLTATLHNVSPLAGVPVNFLVTGANPQAQLVTSDANGNAAFTYTALHAGTDTVTAVGRVSTTSLAANSVQVTWESGKHVTFLTLNPSPQGGTVNQPVTVLASLSDVSAAPIAPLGGQSVIFTLGNASCSAVTTAKGTASCQLTPSQLGTNTLTATFASNSQYVEASDSVAFHVLAAVVATPVPNVVGLTQAAASTAITGAGLVVGTVTMQGSTTVAAGLVISESPTAGTSVAKGSAVSLVVSTGPAPVAVPNVVGQTQALATTAITGANLLVGTVTRQSEWIILPGVVVGQSPAAGSSAAVKSAVNLVVSSGSTCADMEIVKAAFGSKRGQPAYNPLADVNNDGVVNVLDLSMVARALPAGTVCN